MIGHSTSVASFADYRSLQKDGLSPAKSAEKDRLESRLSELEKKMQDQSKGISPVQKEQKEALQSRDAEVKRHEQAHLAAAGSLAKGGMKLDYQTGPDGRSYAIGGSVSIDTSPGKTPEETIIKAQRIRSSAMSPAEPSVQDIKVAAQASKMEAEARAEIAKREMGGSDNGSPQISSLKQLIAQGVDHEDDDSDGEKDDGEADAFIGRVAQGYERSQQEGRSVSPALMNYQA